jgi:hypothetical protein
MGIDRNGFEFLLYSLKYVKDFSNILTLGRQFIYEHNNIKDISAKYGYALPESCYVLESEPLFKELGFKSIDSIDYSNYEQATIIHDMNMPITTPNKYKYIFDGGCSEHIFNVAQVYSNIVNLLDVGGLYVSVVPNNNYSGHGFYQFSPEFYLSAFNKQYGMELLDLYLIEVGDSFDNLVNVKSYNNGRNTTRLSPGKETCILTIARKIENVNVNFISLPPQQYSYEYQSWRT